MTALSPPNQPPGITKLASVLSALALGAATLGLVVGLREPSDFVRGFRPDAKQERHLTAPPAVPYRQMGEEHQRPNAQWPSTLAALKMETPDPFAPVVRTEELKQQALADRAAVRAFDGAPPTIPHPVDQQTDANCLACHRQGMKIGERFASRMCHPLLNHCTQCHVATAALPFSPERELIESNFVGVYRAGGGERAWSGAPPAIPHSTWMRQDCASCHGLIARPGLRTSHIWRTNCTQCHAPSAALDQSAVGPVPVEISTENALFP